MKHVLKTLAVAALVASSHAVFADDSPFQLAAERNVGQPASNSHADQLTQLDMSGPAAFPMAAESAADRHARECTLLIGSASPFPVAAESSVGQPPLDTYADRYARRTRFAGPDSARADIEKWSLEPSAFN